MVDDNGSISFGEASVSTVEHFVRVVRKEDGTTGNKDMRRYERKHISEVWYGDTCFGPYMTTPEGKKRVYFIALIDDASRFIVGADVFFNDTFENLMTVIRSAVSKYGRPKLFTLDNGPSYHNGQMELLAARIESAVHYCEPYTPVGKSKIERWFLSVRQQLLATLDMRDYHDLKGLSDVFASYVDRCNRTIHSSLSGKTPQERFFSFVKNAKDIPVDTEESSEVMVRLRALEQIQGIGILTGESGSGKTTSVRKWASSLNPSRFKVCYTSLSTVTVMDFYRKISGLLGTETRYRKCDIFNDIQREIRRLALEKRITPVIIVDEADKLTHKVLSDLQILFHFDMDSRDHAIILLVGQPYLNLTLNQNTHESLRQRVVMNYHMSGITKEEGRRYISEKLEGAGYRQEVFDENAIEAILNAANGIPRVINKYCNRSMMIGGSFGQNIIDGETVRKAVKDSQLG